MAGAAAASAPHGALAGPGFPLGSQHTPALEAPGAAAQPAAAAAAARAPMHGEHPLGVAVSLHVMDDSTVRLRIMPAASPREAGAGAPSGPGRSGPAPVTAAHGEAHGLEVDQAATPVVTAPEGAVGARAGAAGEGSRADGGPGERAGGGPGCDPSGAAAAQLEAAGARAEAAEAEAGSGLGLGQGAAVSSSEEEAEQSSAFTSSSEEEEEEVTGPPTDAEARALRAELDAMDEDGRDARDAAQCAPVTSPDAQALHDWTCCLPVQEFQRPPFLGREYPTSVVPTLIHLSWCDKKRVQSQGKSLSAWVCACCERSAMPDWRVT